MARSLPISPAGIVMVVRVPSASTPSIVCLPRSSFTSLALFARLNTNVPAAPPSVLKVTWSPAIPGGGGATLNSNFCPSAPGAEGQKFEFRVAPPPPGMAGDQVTFKTEGGAAGTFVFKRANNANEVKEDLGKQTIEGVEAEGTRTTITIPAGEIGNERAIEIVNERWYSPELQLVVMTRHSDPRSGEMTYKLTNINRAEPAKSLFEVPAGYTVKEGPIGPKIAPLKPRKSANPE